MLVEMIKLNCYSVKSTTFYNTQAITDCKVITSCSLSLSTVGSQQPLFFCLKHDSQKVGWTNTGRTGLSLRGIKRWVGTFGHPVMFRKSRRGWFDMRGWQKVATDSGHNLSKHVAHGGFAHVPASSLTRNRRPQASLKPRPDCRPKFHPEPPSKLKGDVVWSLTQVLPNGLKTPSDVWTVPSTLVIDRQESIRFDRLWRHCEPEQTERVENRSDHFRLQSEQQLNLCN